MARMLATPMRSEVLIVGHLVEMRERNARGRAGPAAKAEPMVERGMTTAAVRRSRQ